MSLYQKYRPQEFDSLSGQSHIKKSLQAALQKNLVAHAYLFCGPRGTGKTTTARLLAKSLNCPKFNIEKLEPCNECEICMSITDSSLIDVIEIDAASNRGIDEIRELKETIKFAPTIAKNKIYIIDEVHMLTNEAFNALLKTLEEPPANVYFILATTDVHKLPDTIISRCQRFDFRRITTKDLIDRLKFIVETEKLEYEDLALEMISIYADGGLRDAISILDQLSVSGNITLQQTQDLLGSTGLDTIYNFLDLLMANQEEKAFILIRDIVSEGIDVNSFKADLLRVVREKLHVSIEQNDLSTKARLLRFVELWHELDLKFKNSPIPELSLEVLIVQFCNNFKNIDLEPMPISIQQEVPKQTVKKKESTPLPSVEKSDKLIKNELPNETLPVEKNNNSPTPDKVDSPKTTTNEPEVKPDITAAKKEVKKVKVKQETKPSISSDEIIKNWKSIVEKITIPTLRLTLRNTQFSLSSEGMGKIIVSSNFDYEQLNKVESLSKLHDHLLSETGHSIDLNVIKELKSFKETEPTTSHSLPSNEPLPPEDFSPESSHNQNTEADILDIFDGEMIE